MTITKTTTLDEMIAQQDHRQMKISEAWVSHFFLGAEDVQQESNICSPARIVEITAGQMKEMREQGCTKIEVTQVATGHTLLVIE